MKKITLILITLFMVLGLSSCQKANTNETDTLTGETPTQSEAQIESKLQNETPEQNETENQTLRDSQEKESQAQTNENTMENSTEENHTEENHTEENHNDISQKVKEYIINGQGNKPEAAKLKWSESFLNALDIETIYQEYLNTGGIADDVEDFALYLTSNAPVLDNWEELFKADFSKTYGEKITRIEHLEDDLYQVYIEYGEGEVPYVVVSSRTGYFHG